MTPKIITITPNIFNNEWGESFCKAIQGNIPLELNDSDRVFVGTDSRYKYPFYVSDLCQYEKLSFDISNLDIDWISLVNSEFIIKYWCHCTDKKSESLSIHHLERYDYELDLEWLSKQDGIKIK